MGATTGALAANASVAAWSRLTMRSARIQARTAQFVAPAYYIVTIEQTEPGPWL